jgi:hypothetical protein
MEPVKADEPVGVRGLKTPSSKHQDPEKRQDPNSKLRKQRRAGSVAKGGGELRRQTKTDDYEDENEDEDDKAWASCRCRSERTSLNVRQLAVGNRDCTDRRTVRDVRSERAGIEKGRWVGQNGATLCLRAI